MNQKLIEWGLAAVSPLLRNYTFTMRSGLARGLKRRWGYGFRPGGKETAEQQFLAGLDLAGKTVYDVGGYVGILTLFFARAVGPAGRVVTWKPNPENFAELSHHVQLNRFSNVTLRNAAVGRAPGEAELSVGPIYRARGTLRRENAPSAASSAAETIHRVPVEALDVTVHSASLPPPDFIKIDVEGFENDAVAGMQQILVRHRPALFIEIHGLPPAELPERLANAGYQIHHVELARLLTLDEARRTAEGHWYCTGV